MKKQKENNVLSSSNGIYKQFSVTGKIKVI
jgi:hypothetical protein